MPTTLAKFQHSFSKKHVSTNRWQVPKRMGATVTPPAQRVMPAALVPARNPGQQGHTARPRPGERLLAPISQYPRTGISAARPRAPRRIRFACARGRKFADRAAVSLPKIFLTNTLRSAGIEGSPVAIRRIAAAARARAASDRRGKPRPSPKRSSLPPGQPFLAQWFTARRFGVLAPGSGRRDRSPDRPWCDRSGRGR